MIRIQLAPEIEFKMDIELEDIDSLWTQSYKPPGKLEYRIYSDSSPIVSSNLCMTASVSSPSLAAAKLRITL